MKFIEDVQDNAEMIENCISRYGSSPEHNYCHYRNLEECGAKNIFISFGNSRGILAQHFKSIGEWVMIGDVLAPENERLDLLFKAIESISGKFVVEVSEGFRRKIVEKTSSNKCIAAEPRYALYWPVFDFSKWTGDKLEGGDWKKLRNIRNHFIKQNKVEIVDSSSISKERLKALIIEWAAMRSQMGVEVDKRGNNKALCGRYLNMVESGFAGIKLAKSVLVNGEPCSITAGWEIPNSNKGYYSGVGIYNYKYDGLGEYANMEDLSMLKAKGYDLVDFGGSPKSLLNYKLKFRPTGIYKTYTFVIGTSVRQKLEPLAV